MTRLSTKLSVAALFLSVATSSLAIPTDALVQKISAHVVKIQVALANGGYGIGSGVVVAKDQVVTNCHVIADARSINVVSNGEAFSVSAIKPDWHHDVCIVKTEGLTAPIATIASSKNLKYEQPVFTVGFPNNSPHADSTFGYVKGLYAMDDSVIVRASSPFRMGASGGGVFDEVGNLVAIITLKSPGRNAFYYNMPVEWVQHLLTLPEQSVVSQSGLPFWAEKEEKWPYFMRVVHPLKTDDWNALYKISSAWLESEPYNNEALFYQAIADYGLKNAMVAENKFKLVVARNSSHSSAIYYLGLIAQENGKRIEALARVASLTDLDDNAASELKLAMGITDGTSVSP
jgi:hypothetical protein